MLSHRYPRLSVHGKRAYYFVDYKLTNLLNNSLPAGWLIPIAIFVIISFPPLFGHEILGVLCGVVWGLGVGFAIVAAGTFLGEMANF